MCFNHSVIFCVAFSNMSLSGCKMTKSSAYRTKIGFISLYFIPSVIAVSIPCKAMLASNGEHMPPTMWQTLGIFFGGELRCLRRRIDPEHHTDLLLVELNA